MNDFQLTVLNPRGNDPDQDFPNGAGSPHAPVHAPVNYHAFAACTGGSFLKTPSAVGKRPVLLLLGRDLTRAARALPALTSAGNTVAVAFKEAGSHQVAETLGTAKQWTLFKNILAQVHGAVATTPELVPLFSGAGMNRVAFIPTPYPTGHPGWDFSLPVADRAGVFIGTREFEVPSRRHLAALVTARLLVCDTGHSVTVVNVDGRRGRTMLEALGFPPGKLQIVEGRTSYPEYLRLMARHKIVWQLDRSRVPGQVAGDALLCGIPCLGGDGAVDRLAFPDFHGCGREDAELIRLSGDLLGDNGTYEMAVAKIPAHQAGPLSFSGARAALAEFFALGAY